MRLPQRLPAAAREIVRRRWPNGRLLRAGRAWAIVGRVDRVSPHETADRTDMTSNPGGVLSVLSRGSGQEGLPVGWYSVLIADVDHPDGDAVPRLWWTAATWGLRRRRDAVASALTAEQEVRS